MGGSGGGGGEGSVAIYLTWRCVAVVEGELRVTLTGMTNDRDREWVMGKKSAVR